MRALVGVVVGVALNVASVAAADLGSHVRISDGDLKALTFHSATRSETLRALLVRLDTTSVLVFVDCDWYLPSGIAGHTTFITAVDGLRYVRVAIGCALPLRQRLPILAHELQHALEIGENPAVTDVDSMESYYEGAGFETYSHFAHRWFETDAAIDIQRRVDQELYGKSVIVPAKPD